MSAPSLSDLTPITAPEPIHVVAWAPKGFQPTAQRPQRAVRITQTQRRVLESLCEGKNNAEIGRDWGIAEDTVKSHVKALLKRTGCRDRLVLAVQVHTSELRVWVSRTGRWWDRPLSKGDALELIRG